MAWQDTGFEAGAEVEAAKAAALASFMAAPVDSDIGASPAVPPQISRTVWTQAKELSSGDVTKLKKVVNAAIMDATLKHIGPVSTDGSVTIDISEVDGIKKLDLRSSAISWEHVTVDPSASPGLARDIFKIVWQDNLDTIPKPVALWVKINTSDTAWTKLWPETGDHKFSVDQTDEDAGGAGFALTKFTSPNSSVTFSRVAATGGQPAKVGMAVSIPSPTPLSNVDPLPDGDVADPGTGSAASREDHVHPLTRPAKIRYYLSDTDGTGDWTGKLLLLENPHAEDAAVDLAGAGNMFRFVSAPGSPGLAVWGGGSVHAHFRVKLTGARNGRTYRLYMGNRDIVYTSLIGDWTSGDVYQTTPYPTEPTITTSYADFSFDIPVATLSAGTSHRFDLKLVLRAFVGSSEDSLSGEQIVVRVGGDNASYLDTPFTPDGGFSGVHNDLDGREAANAHPQDAITPGRIHSPVGGAITTASGLFAMPSNSNSAILDGSEALLGCSTVGWMEGDKIDVCLYVARDIQHLASSLPDGYAPFGWSAGALGADGETYTATALSCFTFRLLGGVWRMSSMPVIP